jgi:hypothetical protein
MSSYFNLLGGFFFVDRCNSVAIFVFNRTSTSAEKTDNVTWVSATASGSISTTGSAGKGAAMR